MTRQRDQWWRDDRGSIAVYTAICAVALLALIALLVDGYGRVRAVEQADALATEAARAGSQAVDPARAVPGRAVVADPQAARVAAQAYLRSRGASATVTVSDSGRQLTVSVHTTYVAKFVPVELAVSGNGHASLVRGVAVEEEP
ncbi:hypothetical protein [Streptomyces noursei]|uniref:Uncharacterized protein n=1 Tax=Streptomyces noursei TaxID=1971 RepID=A0A2N8PQY1_STRNR|nr:hypothetical protein [Streptomyces noursei]PNE43440.1 hypothetical protein AOB60_00460 [Streptomyces noursei]